LLALLSLGGVAWANEPILMASSPDLSSDGGRIVFSWRGDIWSVPTEGGTATRLTSHPARDTSPKFSPDGSEIAFTSEREGARQVFVMPAGCGAPRQLTFDTNGCYLRGWFPDGESLLVLLDTDRFWRRTWRLCRLSVRERTAPEMLFDGYGDDGSLSPDGKRLLFTREGTSWWRKGYRGSQASQVWLYDLEKKTFTKVLHEETGCRWPLWLPDGKSFLYVGASGGAFNLMRFGLESGEKRRLTKFPDDSVVSPTVGADGTVVVFRHLFHLCRFRPGIDAAPQRIVVENAGDSITPATERKVLRKAEEAAFSPDGLEVAFVAGGDLWVMDTVLREPKRITNTPEEERSPAFHPDGKSIYYVSDARDQSDVCRAERADPEAFWWRNDAFDLSRRTDDQEVESRLTVSPDGSRLAFVRGRGDLVVLDLESESEILLVRSFTPPPHDWSPDGKWIAYAVNDDDFNVDVWIVPADGSAEPVNVSRHPDDEGGPVWSPDGRLLAFTGRRFEKETDVHYVWLRKEDDEATKRDRTLEEALEKMKKERKEKPPKKGKKPPEEEKGEKKAKEPEEPESGEEEKEEDEEKKEEEEQEPEEAVEVVIDFERIHERVRRISIPNATESGLFWSPDSKKLAFAATIDGRKGTYTVEIEKDLKPSFLTAAVGSGPRWLEKGNRVLWLVSGVPTVSTGPKSEPLPFSVKVEVDRVAKQGAGFDIAWRTMRDFFYDGNLGNRDWGAIRRKYRGMAAAAPDLDIFARVVNLMLGELNASHLGFSARRTRTSRNTWSDVTAHLGIRWDSEHRGPGLRVADVIPDGPADRAKSRIVPGEIVVSIDGSPVAPQDDLTRHLNGPPDRDVVLEVQGEAPEPRTVRLRPITLAQARSLLYRQWVRTNRAKVAERSLGALGYLHVRGMNWTSFQEFERELYAEGYGKDGLVIDVRYNGGGFTTDHLLTALTQPVHAITIQRGGGPGYPQDRKVYATWSKPIVVLVNQASFSNAEIFAHAIKTLGRGKLVGVPTAGGVISTGGRRIMDLGFLRTPGRGWEDMEQNGAVPDHVIWPEPGEMPRGVDRQLAKAVEVLLSDVTEWKARPRPKLRKASER
jgi:tricorn protease